MSMYPVTSGTSHEPDAKYPALQDFVFYHYMTSTRLVVEENLGALGDSLQTIQDALPYLKAVYDTSADTSVAVTREGVPTTTIGYSAAKKAIFGDPSATGYNENETAYSKLNALVNSGTLSGTAKLYLSGVVDNLAAWENSPDKWSDWYASNSAHQNISSSMEALISLNTQSQSDLKMVMFLYQEFIKGSSMMFSAIDELQQSLTLNIRT
jgi:hypothetical protein